MNGMRKAYYMNEPEEYRATTFDKMITEGYVPIRRRGTIITFRSVTCPAATASFPRVDFGLGADTIKLVDEAAFLSSKPGKVVLGEFVVDETAAAREATAAKEALAYAKGLYPQAWA